MADEYETGRVADVWVKINWLHTQLVMAKDANDGELAEHYDVTKAELDKVTAYFKHFIYDKLNEVD